MRLGIYIFSFAILFPLSLFSTASAQENESANETFTLGNLRGFIGTIAFDSTEVQQHLASLDILMTTTSACMQEYSDTQKAFFAQWGFSKYYGTKSPFKKMTEPEQIATLATFGAGPEVLQEMSVTSCIDMARTCLQRGFEAANQQNLWLKIDAYNQANGKEGSSLQNALRELGWKVLYWNPNTSRNAAWDADERIRYPGDPGHIWGYHVDRWNAVQTKGKYFFNPVDDITTLVNFGRNVPQRFKEVPFFLGVAHAGYHVFPGIYGHVIEAHSTREITDPNTVEDSPFNPLANGGGPRGQYRSGIIAIPPGY